MSSVIRALRPLTMVAWLFGLFVISFRVQNRCLNILSTLTLWIGYHSLTQYCYKFYGEKLSQVPILVTFSGTCAMFVATISSVAIAVNAKKLHGCLDDFKTVDDTLRRLSIEGYSMRYRKIWAVLTVSFLLPISISVAEGILVAFLLRNQWFNIMQFLGNYPSVVGMVIDLVFIVLTWYIGTRFMVINRGIRMLAVENQRVDSKWRPNFTSPLFVDYNPIGTKKNERLVWVLMHTHLELRKITREVNEIFGGHISMQMTVYFMYLTAVFIRFYDSMTLLGNMPIVQIVTMTTTALWTVTHLGRFIAINHCCAKISKEAALTKVAIDSFLCSTWNGPTREEIKQFAWNIIAKPLAVQGSGITYGYEYIGTFVSTLLQTLIIMMQTHTFTKMQLLQERIREAEQAAAM